jgi:hypothetical protein
VEVDGRSTVKGGVDPEGSAGGFAFPLLVDADE